MPVSLYQSDYATLRAQMKFLRKSAGVSQIGMASRLELSQSYISKIERGESYVDVLLWCRWCEACGVSPGEALDATFGTRPKR